MDINLELYKVFYEVSRSLSFSEAANHLFISQSAVSQSIKTLENKLGISLFFRSTKQVRLTKEGSLLFKHIEPAMNLIRSGEQHIGEIHGLEAGEIHIGASDTICKYFLLPYFKAFHKQYPQIHIQITNRTSTKCVELLKQGKVDLIISNLPNEELNNSMKVHKVAGFEDIFIAGEAFSHLKKTPISLHELKNLPLLLLEKNTTTRTHFDTFILEHKISLTPEIELGSIDLLIEMARIGLGLSFVPDYCLSNLHDSNLFCLNIAEKLPKRHLAVITHESIPLSLASRKFLDILSSLHFLT